MSALLNAIRASAKTCRHTFMRGSACAATNGTGRSMSTTTPTTTDATTALPSHTPSVASTSSSAKSINILPPTDPLLTYLARSLQRHGQAQKSQRLINNTLIYIHTFTRAPPLPILRQALELASPAVKTVSHKIATKSIAIPRALSEKQRIRQGWRWILAAVTGRAKGREGRLEERLAKEIIKVAQGEGDAIKKKREVHAFVTANRGNMRTRV